MYLKMFKLQYLFHVTEDKKRIRIRVKIDIREISGYDQEACVLKGIDRSFELRGEIGLNRFVRTNWRLGIFFFILKGHHHKISKKPIDAA